LTSTIVQGATAISANALTSNLRTVESAAENTRQISNLLGNTASQAVSALADTKESGGIKTSTLIIGGVALLALVLILRK
jgi:hypothetical protein